jgi:hypothetical protein
MSKYRHRTRGAAQDHNIAVVLSVQKKNAQAMLNNKFKYWEGQILCIRLNYRTARILDGNVNEVGDAGQCPGKSSLFS